MKTKIKTISPDQNIIEHESGLKTVFVEGAICPSCIYFNGKCLGTLVPCEFIVRKDKLSGCYVKLLNQ